MDDRSDRDGDAPSAEDGEGKSAAHVATEGESWRFSLEDLEADRETVTPGSPSLENAAFVALGAAATLFVVLQFVL